MLIDDDCWTAVLARDRAFDGRFVTGVLTTGTRTSAGTFGTIGVFTTGTFGAVGIFTTGTWGVAGIFGAAGISTTGTLGGVTAGGDGFSWGEWTGFTGQMHAPAGTCAKRPKKIRRGLFGAHARA